MKELWELFDINCFPTGQLWERSDHPSMPEGVYHKVVEIWVRVGDRILLTQRHPDKWGGLLWEASGGAVLAGESVPAGAVRELAEETGICVLESQLRYLGRWINSKAIIESFVVYLDELPELKLQPTEVVDAMTVTPTQIDAMADRLTTGTKTRYAMYRHILSK